ncbi:MAG: hypothetical protein L0206_08355, partial [Actinobacteria bacterium]|nr:hypothetical protein [Actinomycetota bacterium]
MDRESVEAMRARFEGIWCERRAAFLLASGPSLTPEVVECVEFIARGGGFATIVINDSYRRAPWAEVLYSSDDRFWHRTGGAPEFPGMKLSGAEETTCFPGAWNVVAFPGVHRDTFSFEFPILGYGCNSGFSAINLAIHLGIRSIVLVGYNMGPAPDGRTHWDGHPPPLVKSSYDRFRRSFERAAVDPAFRESGVE